MGSVVNLRGVVLSKYKTIGEFANKIGWKRNKASRVLNGVQKITQDDIEELTVCLEIYELQAFMQVFFANLSTK